MECTGDELLARAALAVDEDGCVRGGHPHDESADGLHGVALAKDLPRGLKVNLVAEIGVLVLDAPPVF